MALSLPDKYVLFNSLQTKNVAISVKIDGLDDLLSTTGLFTRVRYGDPDIHYGDPGLVYGGIRRLDGVRDYLDLAGSSLTISQKIEPEKGKGSISQFTLAFIDKDGYMSRLAGGAMIGEILGRAIQVFVGYVDISFPEDYIQIFRGYITGASYQAGRVIFSLSDPNYKRRTNLFYTAKSDLTAGISPTDTTIPVGSTGDFHQQILGPDGTYTGAVSTFIQIEDEIMEYGPAGITSPTTFTVTRGARGTTAVAHTAGTAAEARVEIEDHAIDMALRIMFSGWAGTWKDSVPIIAVRETGDVTLGNVPGALVLPSFVDADLDYGLVVGDWVYITGGPNNGASGFITRFIDLNGEPNRIIVLNIPLTTELTTSAVIAFRSQYDVYPVNCGLKLPAYDVDVARFVNEKDTYLSSADNTFRFFRVQSESSGKDFIETQIFKPLGLYSNTRSGRVSLGVTRPPIADEELRTLDGTNLQNVQNIIIGRAVNTRKFFNMLTYNYDYSDAGDSQSIDTTIDEDSKDQLGTESELAIDAEGARSDLNFQNVIAHRSNLFLSRYKRGAVEFQVETNWENGSLIESGDIVLVEDNGSLQLLNFSTGERDLGSALYEVTDRSLDLKTGRAKLGLVAGVGFEADDRFATISPSSLIAPGSTQTQLVIQDSFGAIYPGDEQRKWTSYIGLPVLVHSPDYSFAEETTLTGFDTVNRYLMNVSGLSISPPAGYIIDIPNYSTSTDPAVNQKYKLIHTHFDPQVPVVTGISDTQFTVGAGDVAKFFVGSVLQIHNLAYTLGSPDVTVTDVTGTTITVGSSIGFTPSGSSLVDLIGFADHGGGYRYV
jgi:hypothetical protein